MADLYCLRLMCKTDQQAAEVWQLNRIPVAIRLTPMLMGFSQAEHLLKSAGADNSITANRDQSW